MISPEEFKRSVQFLPEKYLRSPSKKSLQDFREEIRVLSQAQVDYFHSYLLLPIVVKLENLDGGKQSELKVDLINCIISILKRVHLRDFTAMRTMVILVLKEIHDFETGAFKPNLSEEIQIAALTCIEEIFKRSNSDLLEKFYVRETTMILAKISLTCVSVLQTQKYRALRIAAINCLMASFYIHNDADFDDTVLRHDVANIVFLFIPKISLILKEVSTSDDTVGKSLIALSITAFGRLICLIFEDNKSTTESLIPQLSDFAKLLNKSPVTIRSDNEILDIKGNESPEIRFKKRQEEGRSEEWLKAAARKLTPLLKQMQILRINKSDEVRLEFAIMCCNILEKCQKTLCEVMHIYIESAIVLSTDQNEAISRRSKRVFVFQVETKTIFEDHLSRLPRIIHRADDEEQKSEFLFLKGLFGLLNDKDIVSLFTMPGNLEKFCTCLISAFDLKLHIDLLNDESALRILAYENISFPWKRFKFLNSNRTVAILEETCTLLGSTSVAELIADHLMELLRSNSNFSNEIILILMFLLCKEGPGHNNHVIEHFVDELLDERHWHLALRADDLTISNKEEARSWFVDRTPGLYESAVEVKTFDTNQTGTNMNDGVSVLDAQLNVLHTCIILYALGNVALAMKSDFRSKIFFCLHRVLLKSGSTNYMVYMSGTFALKSIVDALDYRSIGHIIHEFTDYITFNMNKCLKKSNDYLSAVELLTVILRHSSMKSMTHLHSIMYTMLNECSKLQHPQKITSFLRVFREFLTQIKIWSTNVVNELPFVENVTNNSNANDIYSDWLERLSRPDHFDEFENKNNLSGIDNEMETEEMDVAIAPKGTRIDLPSHKKITKDILNEILKCVSSKHQTLRIDSLECLIIGLPLLKDYENELLPLVHTIWYPFLICFKANDAIVLNRCFELLDVLASVARDFILQRTMKDIIPFLNKFLIDSAKRSKMECNLTFTQEYKLQLNLLQRYANLICSMEMQVKEVDSICNAVLCYLSPQQPSSFQTGAIDFFVQLASYNKPLVFINLLFLYENKNVQTIFSSIGVK